MDMRLHHLPFIPGPLTLAIATILLASPPVPHAMAAEHSAGQPMDWQPIQQLPLSRRAAEPFFSCGAYIEPSRPGQNYTGDINQAPIIAESDVSSYDPESVATFQGDVTIRQGSRQLESDKASLDRQRNYGQFEGNVRFRDKGMLLVGDKGDLQLDSGKGTLENAAYVMHEQKARGNATRIVRNENATLDLTDATYTTCPPGDTSWQLSGQKVTLNMDSGQGQAKNAVVRVGGLPILYTPYISFPIDDRRKSGFLYPTISESSDNGLDFSIPYYLNIAPNYDGTFTPRYMSKRGIMLENEFRYLVGNSRGELGLAGLLNKDKQQKENPYYNDHRWLVNFRHTSDLTRNWVAEVDYAKASDKNYLDDFSTGLDLSANSPLNQRFSTRYLGGDTNHSWQLSLDAHQYQNMNQTADDPYNKLPQIKLSGNWLATDNISIHYGADYTRFSRDPNWDYRYEQLVDPSQDVYESIYGEGYGIDRADGERLYMETGANLSFERSYGFVRPALKVQHVQYRLTNLIESDTIADLGASYQGFTAADYTESPSTTVPTVSVDSGLYFDRFTTIGGTPFTHTLEPRMKYLYSPYVAGQEMNPIFDTGLMGFNYHSLWRDSRFSGYDRLGDANQLSIGLTSRLLEDDGFERVRFGIGQIIYFEDRQLWINPLAGTLSRQPSDEDEWDVNLNEEGQRLWNEMHESVSPLASELVYNINRKMSLRQDLMWDTNNNELDNYALYYQYQPNPRSVINAGYRYLRQSERYVKNPEDGLVADPANPGQWLTTNNNLSQTDLSFAWPVTQNWSAMGRWQYDLTNKRNLEFLSGVEYNSCCYQVRLMWRKWIDDDNNIDYPEYKDGIVLQFVLRGLGALTSGSTKEYLEGIRGYPGDDK